MLIGLHHEVLACTPHVTPHRLLDLCFSSLPNLISLLNSDSSDNIADRCARRGRPPGAAEAWLEGNRQGVRQPGAEAHRHLPRREAAGQRQVWYGMDNKAWHHACSPIHKCGWSVMQREAWRNESHVHTMVHIYIHTYSHRSGSSSRPGPTRPAVE